MPGPGDPPEILDRLRVAVVLHVFEQHLAVADDGVHRRALFVALFFHALLFLPVPLLLRLLLSLLLVLSLLSLPLSFFFFLPLSLPPSPLFLFFSFFFFLF